MITLFSNWEINEDAKSLENLGMDKLPERSKLQKYNDFLEDFFNLKMSDEDKETLIKLDREYGYIYSMRNLDYNREIINLNEEKQRFFQKLSENKRYNPIFEHNPEKFKGSGILEYAIELQKKFKLFDCFLSEYYVENLEFFINYVKLIQMDRNSQEFVNLVNIMYSKPSPELVSKAYEIINQNPYKKVSKNAENIDAYSMKIKMEKVLKDLGYDKWKVKITDEITPRMNVKDNYIVNINANAKFTEDDFLGLVEHEIKGHVGRRFYGDKTGLILFRNGLNGKNELDEGLAIFNSLQFKKPKSNILFNISFFTLIISQIDKMDFYDLFQFGKQFIKNNDQKLFNKIARCKRVCNDTSVLVGDIYEADYLKGYLRLLNTTQSERQDILKFNVGVKDYDNIDKIRAFLTVNDFIDQYF